MAITRYLVRCIAIKEETEEGTGWMLALSPCRTAIGELLFVLAGFGDQLNDLVFSVNEM